MYVNEAWGSVYMSCEALASVHMSFKARSLVRMSFEACASVCHLKRRRQCVVHSTKLFQRYYFTVFILWTGRFWNIHISTTEAKKKKEGHNSLDSKFVPHHQLNKRGHIDHYTFLVPR